MGRRAWRRGQSAKSLEQSAWGIAQSVESKKPGAKRIAKKSLTFDLKISNR